MEHLALFLFFFLSAEASEINPGAFCQDGSIGWDYHNIHTARTDGWSTRGTSHKEAPFSLVDDNTNLTEYTYSTVEDLKCFNDVGQVYRQKRMPDQQGVNMLFLHVSDCTLINEMLQLKYRINTPSIVTETTSYILVIPYNDSSGRHERTMDVGFRVKYTDHYWEEAKLRHAESDEYGDKSKIVPFTEKRPGDLYAKNLSSWDWMHYTCDKIRELFEDNQSEPTRNTEIYIAVDIKMKTFDANMLATFHKLLKNDHKAMVVYDPQSFLLINDPYDPLRFLRDDEALKSIERFLEWLYRTPLTNPNITIGETMTSTENTKNNNLVGSTEDDLTLPAMNISSILQNIQCGLYSKRLLCQPPVSLDHIELFCLPLVAPIHRLSFEKQAIIKIHLQKLLYRAEFGDLEP